MRRRVPVLAAVLCVTAPLHAQDIPLKLSLADALRLAIERNPSLAAASAEVDVARAERIGAGRLPNPALTFESEGQQIPFRSRAAGDGHEYLVRLDQEIDTPGRRGLRLVAADLLAQSAQAQFANERRRLELEVRRAYFQAALAKADREVSATALEEIDKVIVLNRARLEQGEISGAELRRVQVERLRFQDDVFAAELALRNARASLLALMNAPDMRQPVDPVDSLTLPAQGVAAVIGLSVSQIVALNTEAISARPDVLAARADVRRAETETRLQRALRRPLPTVGGGYKEDGGGKAFVFGITVPLPLFNQNQGTIARANAQQRSASNRAAAVERQVGLEVQQALNAVEVNRERVSYIEREFLKNARDVRDVILASYRLGSADLIDLLDAQRAFRDTVRTYNRALYEQRLSYIELGAAVGRPDGAK